MNFLSKCETENGHQNGRQGADSGDTLKHESNVLGLHFGPDSSYKCHRPFLQLHSHMLCLSHCCHRAQYIFCLLMLAQCSENCWILVALGGKSRSVSSLSSWPPGGKRSLCTWNMPNRLSETGRGRQEGCFQLIAESRKTVQSKKV